MEKIEGYLPALLGLAVFVLLLALNKAHLFSLSSTELENLLIDIFVAFAIAQLTDGILRDRQFRRIVQDELKRGLADNTKLMVFSNAEEAYQYLSTNVPRATTVRNTIIHTSAYSYEGILPSTKSSVAYNTVKHRVIKRGKVYWEDIISPNYREYVQHLCENHFHPGVSKYCAFFLKQPLAAFQNFIILEYSDEYAEVMVGWVVTYGAITSGQKCFLIANKDLVRHYQEYFAAIRDNNCEIASLEFTKT